MVDEKRRSLRDPVSEDQSITQQARDALQSPSLRSQPQDLNLTGSRENRDLNLSDTVDTERVSLRARRRGRNAFQRGVDQGVDTTRATLPAVESIARGLVGDEEGATSAATRAAELQQRGAELGPQVSFQDVREGNAGVGEYVAGVLGTQAPVMASLVASGGVGGTAARVGGSLARRQAVNQARNRVAGRLAPAVADPTPNLTRQALVGRAARRGQATGAYAAGFGLQAGESVDILLDEDSGASIQERATAALGGAAATAGFEALPIMTLFDRVGLGNVVRTGALRELTENTAVNIVAGAGSQAVIEGGTEVAQSIAMKAAHRMVNENIELFSDEALLQYMEEGIAGALVGGVLGGATSVTVPQRGPAESETAELIAQSEQDDARRRAQNTGNVFEGSASERLDNTQTQFTGMAMLEAVGKQQGVTAEELAQALAGDENFNVALEVGTALRTLLDPDAQGETQVEVGGETMTRAEAAAEYLAQRYNIDANSDELLNVARTALAESEKFQIENLQVALEDRRRIEQIEETVPGDSNERQQLEAELRQRQRRLRQIQSELTGTSSVGTVDDSVLTSADPLEVTEPQIRSVFAQTSRNEGPLLNDSDIRGALNAAPTIGRTFLSNRTPALGDAPNNRAQIVADRLNAETGSSGQFSTQPAGDATVRLLRSQAGLEDSNTAVNNEQIRTLVINEAEQLVASNNARRFQGERALNLNGSDPSVENYNEAVRFLNQFDTVVEEQTPGAALGRDSQQLTAGELQQRGIVRRGVDAVQRATGDPTKLVVADPNGREASIDLVALTQTMISRVDLAGRGGTTEQRQARGDAFESGATGGVSIENIGRAAAAGLAEVFTRNGFVPVGRDAELLESLIEQRQDILEEGGSTAEVDAQIAAQPTIADIINENAVVFRSAGRQTTLGGAVGTVGANRSASALESDIQALTDPSALIVRRQQLNDAIASAQNNPRRANQLTALQRARAEVDIRLETVRQAQTAIRAVVNQNQNPKVLQRVFNNRIKRLSDDELSTPKQLANALTKSPDQQLQNIKTERLSLTKPDVDVTESSQTATIDIADAPPVDITDYEGGRDYLFGRGDAKVFRQLRRDAMNRFNQLSDSAKRKRMTEKANWNKSPEDEANIVRAINELVFEYTQTFDMPAPEVIITSELEGFRAVYRPAMHTVLINSAVFDSGGALTAQMLNTVVHELSHALEVTVLESASEAEINALATEYQNWRDEAQRKIDAAPDKKVAMLEVFNEKRGTLAANRLDPDQIEDISQEYVLNPREWFADSVARMIVEDSFRPSENSLALSVFQRVAGMLRRLYERLLAQRPLTPADTPVLRSIVAQRNERVPVLNSKFKKPADPERSKQTEARLKELDAQEQRAEQLRGRMAKLTERFTREQAQGVDSRRFLLERYSAIAELMALYQQLETQRRREARASGKTSAEKSSDLLQDIIRDSARERTEEVGQNAAEMNFDPDNVYAAPTGQVPPWVTDADEANQLQQELPTPLQTAIEGAEATKLLAQLGFENEVRVIPWSEAVAILDDQNALISESRLQNVGSMSFIDQAGNVTVWVNESASSRADEREAAMTRELVRVTTMLRIARSNPADVAQLAAALNTNATALRKAIAARSHHRNAVKPQLLASAQDRIIQRALSQEINSPSNDFSKKIKNNINAVLQQRNSVVADNVAVRNIGSLRPVKNDLAALRNTFKPMAEIDASIPNDESQSNARAAYIAIKNAFSIDGFNAMRNFAIAKLTAKERGVLARAMLNDRARNQMIAFLQNNSVQPETFLNDEYDLLGLGIAMHKAGLLDLESNGSSVVQKLSAAAHRLVGAIRRSDQAANIINAIDAGNLDARVSLLNEAKAGSNLRAGKYALGVDQVQELNDIMNADGFETANAASVIDSNPEFANLNARTRQWIVEDIENNVFSKTYRSKLLDAGSDFLIDPGKQFVLQTVNNDLNQAQEWAHHIAHFMERFAPLFRVWIGEAMQSRFTGNAAIIRLSNMVYTGVDAKGYGEAMFARKMRRSAAFHGRFHEAIRNLDAEQQTALKDLLLSNTASDDSAVNKARSDIRKLMRELRTYAREAGLPIGDRGADYVPWVFDPIKTAENSDKIIEDWMRDRFADDWNALARERGRIEKGQTLTDPMRRQFISDIVDGIVTENNGLVDSTDNVGAETAPHVQALFRRDLGFIETNGDAASRELLGEMFSDNIGTTIYTYIDQLVKRAEYARTFGADGRRLLNLKRRAQSLGASPRDLALMDNVANSALGRIGLEVAPFWKMVMSPIEQTFMQPVFADNGQPFQTSREAMQVKEDRGLTGRIRQDDRGGYFIDRAITNDPARFRKAQSALVVYQNMVLLPLAALTNVADAAGLFFRSGDLAAAFDGYKTAVQETVRSIRGQELSELRKLGEELGIVESTVTSEILGQLYGGNMMTGRTRRLNDWFFRVNGMEHLTRTLRLSALTTGRRFIEKQANLANTGQPAAVEALRQLDLRPEDVALSDGVLQLLTESEIQALLPAGMTVAGAREQHLDDAGFKALPLGRERNRQEALREVARDDRVKQALNRMVNESVLRPAPTQRPTWMNDPNWQIFSHLKGFFFTYHEQVLRRAYTQAAQGNYTPMLHMSSYVVLMLAMDLLRDAITDGADGDERKRDWEMRDYLNDATRRSGIYGMFGIFPDLAESRQYGGSLAADALGPTVDHMERIIGAAVGRGSVSGAVERSVPFSQVFPEVPQAVLSWADYAAPEGLNLDEETLQQALRLE